MTHFQVMCRFIPKSLLKAIGLLRLKDLTSFKSTFINLLLQIPTTRLAYSGIFYIYLFIYFFACLRRVSTMIPVKLRASTVSFSPLCLVIVYYYINFEQSYR